MKVVQRQTHVAVEYLTRSGKPEAARVILGMMERVAPEHPATVDARRIIEAPQLS